MTYLSQRFLIVFNNHHQSETEVQNKIQHYQTIIQHSRMLKSDKRIEYFLLYVTPHIPSYILQLPEMVAYVAQTTENNKTILASLGEQLEIHSEHQFLAEGATDLQAWHLAKQLKTDKVFGYSKTFIKFLNICKSIQYGWSYVLPSKKKAYKEAN